MDRYGRLATAALALPTGTSISWSALDEFKVKRDSVRQALILLALFGLSCPAIAGEDADNLAPNPGFEAGKAAVPAAWQFGSRVAGAEGAWSADQPHTGKHCLAINVPTYRAPARGYRSAGWSGRIGHAPPAQTVLRISAWLRGRNIVRGDRSWFCLRFTIYAMKDEATRIRHQDIATLAGTFNWRHVETTFVVPTGTRFLRLAINLTGCSGQAWVDDVAVRVEARVPDIEALRREIAETRGKPGPPVIIPRPQSVRLTGGEMSPAAAAVTVPRSDRTLRLEIAEFLKEIASRSETPADGRPTITAEPPDADVRGQLGPQGYVLRVEPQAIRLIGATPASRLYAFQTLRQMVRLDAGRAVITCGVVTDRPEVALRGIPMGVQWWREREEAVRHLARLKGNFIYNTGSFLGGKFGGAFHKTAHWRAPFTEPEKKALGAYLDLCRRYYIQPCLAFSPRGNPPTEYSSDAEVGRLADKMKTLCDLGFRAFSLSYDDLQNIGQHVLTYPSDKVKYDNDIGLAHRAFTRRVSESLKGIQPDATLRIIPLWYGSLAAMDPGRRAYLKTLAALPKKIEFVCCLTDHDEIAARYPALTGRRPFIWDNFFAAFQQFDSQPLLPPFNRSRALRTGIIGGYIFLPIVPGKEDTTHASWLTAADYMWSPARYDPAAAPRRAVTVAVEEQGRRRLPLLRSSAPAGRPAY